MKLTKEEDQPRSSKAEQDAQESSRLPAVVRILFKRSLGLVVRHEVTQETRLGERIADGIQHEDGHNQQRKDIVREPRCHLHVASKVEEGANDNVGQCPDANPGVEGEEGDADKIETCCKGR